MNGMVKSNTQYSPNRSFFGGAKKLGRNQFFNPAFKTIDKSISMRSANNSFNKTQAASTSWFKQRNYSNQPSQTFDPSEQAKISILYRKRPNIETSIPKATHYIKMLESGPNSRKNSAVRLMLNSGQSDRMSVLPSVVSTGDPHNSYEQDQIKIAQKVEYI